MRIKHAAPNRCPRKLVRGEVKRFAVGNQLLCYTIACPGCGYPGPYLHDSVVFLEIGSVELRSDDGSSSRVWRAPQVLSMKNPARCYGCGLTITLTNNEITAS